MDNKILLDYLIIGSGISGLYSAYLIKKKNPIISLLILDKEKREWIGGRTGNEIFYNNEVVTGAGIGRLNKDILLLNLMKDLNIKYNKCEINMNYSKTIKNVVDIKSIINFLKKEYIKSSNKNTTFENFAKPLLGNNIYNNLIICLGYTDYEKTDIYDVLYNYSIDDNIPGWISFQLNWKDLIEKLIKYIGSKNILSNQKVFKIQKLKNEIIDIFSTFTEKNIFYSKKIIIATTITSLKKLLPTFKIYNQIHGQPFLRIYGKFSKKSSNILKHFIPTQTIVPGPLHKMIPLNNDVYMIAYTDNKGAEYLKNYIENTKENRLFLTKIIEKSLGIESCTLDLKDIKGFYWSIGTHYYSPLHNYKNRKEFIKEAQHPMKGIFVIGEMVSNNQGWVEGALESVESIKKEILKPI